MNKKIYFILFVLLAALFLDNSRQYYFVSPPDILSEIHLAATSAASHAQHSFNDGQQHKKNDRNKVRVKAWDDNSATPIPNIYLQLQPRIQFAQRDFAQQSDVYFSSWLFSTYLRGPPAA